MNETTNTTSTTPSTKNPFDNAILLSVTINKLGVSRQTTQKEKEQDITVDADKDLLTVSKVILDCEEYEAIKSAGSAITKYLSAKEIPGVKKELLLKGGVYPIPLAKVDDIDATINTDLIPAFNAAVTRFCEVYPIRAEEGKARLRALGESVEYPPLDKVKQSFGVSLAYVSIGAPASIASVSKQLYDRERIKIQAQCQNAKDTMQDALETMFADIVGNMVDSLTPKEDGSPKKFYESGLTKFKDFFAKVDELKSCDIIDATRIDDLAEQARSILAGKSVNALRKDMDMRAVVKEDMSKIKTSLDAMLRDKPERNIIIDE